MPTKLYSPDAWVLHEVFWHASIQTIDTGMLPMKSRNHKTQGS